MLHIILTSLCLLQFQETYSSYCHCCKPRNFPFCGPVSQNTLQENCFCYQLPKETIPIFHQKPLHEFQSCEGNQNFSESLINENPPPTPQTSLPDSEIKPTPDSTPVMMESKETPMLPVGIPGTTDPSASMIPMNIQEGGQTPGPMLIVPVNMEDGIRLPQPSTMDTSNMVEKSPTPTPIEMVSMNIEGDRPTSGPLSAEDETSPTNAEPLRLEEEGSHSCLPSTSSESIEGLGYLLCPMMPDGYNLELKPPQSIPRNVEEAPSPNSFPMETINRENSKEKPTEEESPKLMPIGKEEGSATLPIPTPDTPMEGGISQPVPMPIDSMTMKEETPTNTMPVSVMMMVEEATAPTSDPISTERETSPMLPYPPVPASPDGGNQTPMNKPTAELEMNIGDPQPTITAPKSPPSIGTVYPNLACVSRYVTPFTELCHTPCRHIQPIEYCNTKSILEAEKSIPSKVIDNSCYLCNNNPLHSTVESSSTSTEISSKYVKPIYEEIVRHVPALKNVVRNRVVETTRHIPIVEKVVLKEQHSIIRHIPIVHKFRRNVEVLRAKHLPILQHRSKIIEEPYIEHVAHTEEVTRPVIETLVRKVPVVLRRVKPIILHRIRHIPVVETRCRPVVEEIVSTLPVRQRIMNNVQQQIHTMISPWTTCALQGLSSGVIFDQSTFKSCSGDVCQL